MGWTGVFGRDLTKSYKDLVKEEFFPNKDWELLKSHGAGSHVWLLSKNKETGFIAASVILCSKDSKKDEFLYKEVPLSSGPSETDMPKSWIKLIDQSYFESEYSKLWLEEFIKNSKTENNIKVGDIYKCTSDVEICWGGSYNRPIKKGEPFYVIVDMFRNRRKFFVSDDGVKKTFYVISKNTFLKHCSKEKV